MPEEPTTPGLEETLRRSVAAYQSHDFDGALSIWAGEGIWDASSLGIGVFEGREAIRGFLEDWLRAYEDYEQVIEEFRDLGNGVTFTVLLQKGRPVGSAGYVQLQYAIVGTWRDGLVKRGTFYTDIDEARAAAERLAQERG
jgi:ketosteroid isomerase-like protein